MKKFLCIFLCILMTVALVSCSGSKTESLKFGFGIYTNVSKANSADGDTDGQGSAAMTAAAVSVDANGKIVSCTIDAADYTVAYTADGKAIAGDSFQTKYEQGDNYNMKAYGGSALEWYEQVDALEAVICGKTLNEVKALVAEGDKGTDEVINAGCTITISDFIYAVEKAYNNAAVSGAASDDVLRIGVQTNQTCSDATEEKDGQNQIDTTFFAAAVDANGKITAASSDSVQITFTFDANGTSTYDLTKAVSTKKELGTNYGMSQYGADMNGDGVVKEWNEQAAAFDSACIGKTAAEVASVMGDNNYGNADLQTAGCTIAVDSFVKAASKIG